MGQHIKTTAYMIWGTYHSLYDWKITNYQLKKSPNMLDTANLKKQSNIPEDDFLTFITCDSVSTLQIANMLAR